MADEEELTPEQLAAQEEARKKATAAALSEAEALKKLREQFGLLANIMKDVNKETKENYENLQKQGLITQESQSAIRDYIEAERDLLLAQEAGKENLKEETAYRDEAKRALAEHGEEVENFATSLIEQAKQQAKVNAYKKVGTDLLKGYSKALNFAGLSSFDFSDGLKGMATQLQKTGLEFDQLNKSIEVSVGLGPQSVQVANEIVEGDNRLAATREELQQAQASLNTAFRQFGTLGKDTQKVMADEVIAMTRLGASADSATAAMDLYNNAMGGMRKEGKSEILPFLNDLSQELGLPTGKVVEDFVKLGPLMARFGKEGKAQMSDLAKRARMMGLDISEAFNIAEAADTFEGASDMAGKLNAQLGAQINSVKLMNMGHADRLGYLKDEIQAAMGQNKQFSELHRRERQAIASMLGVDESIAAKIMGSDDELAKYNQSTEDMRKRSERLTTMNQHLAASLEKIAVHFSGVAMFVADVAVALAEIGPALVIFGMVVGTVMALGKAYLYVTSIIQLFKAAQQASTITQALKIVMNKTQEESEESLARSQQMQSEKMQQGTERFKSFMDNAKQLVPVLLALGAAVLMIGTGIYIAAQGAADLVYAFNGLGDAAGMAALGLAILMVPFVAFLAVAAVALYTGVGPAMAGMFLAMGAGALMLGGGVALAAYGMSLFVESIKGLSEKEALAGVMVLQTLPMILLAMVPALTILSLVGLPVLGGMSIAFLAMGAGMALAAMGAAQFMSSIGGIASLKFGKVAEEMIQVANAIRSLAIAMSELDTGGGGFFGNNTGQLYELADALHEFDGVSASAADGLEALEKVITVSTKISSAELDNMERVMSSVVNVGAAAKAAEMSGFEKIANAIAGMFGGAGDQQSGQQREVVLKVNNNELGRVIVDVLNDKYGMNIAR
jgi:hypothetical protein